jgi:hypothetical protein
MSTARINQSELRVLHGFSANPSEVDCVREVFEQIEQEGMSGVVFFCSPSYNRDLIAREIKSRFNCAVIGCTTAGEISQHGYSTNSLVATSFSGGRINLHTYLISSLPEFTMDAADNLSLDICQELKFSTRLDPSLNFGLLLVDGMSMMEEQVVANLHRCLGGIDLIGGSAGDDLQFRETYIYHDGKFLRNAAVLGLFETTLPFKTFKIQHFQPTDKRLIITECDPTTRTVTAINGGPAAVEYAAAVGLEINELTPMIFAAHPVMLSIGGEFYIRSIQRVNADNSLTFYCAIDNGLVLRVASGIDFVKTLEQQLLKLRQSMPSLKLILGCDCILRKLEILEKGLEQEVVCLLNQYNFIGFSTYGEQFNSVHVNQTLTGVAIGDSLDV